MKTSGQDPAVQFDDAHHDVTPATMLKVAVLSGSWPPDRCGVGDYTARLTEGLQRFGVDVMTLGKDVDFASPKSFLLASTLRQRNVQILHVQYPTIGYGRSIVPALMPLICADLPTVVTIHEFSSFSRMRLPWFLSFAHRSDTRIFSSKHERDTFRIRLRPRAGSDVVLPIPSNIPSAAPVAREPSTVCYFGLLVPHKGIEAFLDLAAIPVAAQQFRFSLIGGVVPDFADYAQAIMARAEEQNVSLHLDLTDDQVASTLASRTYAYLPFPDGASPRRGSLRAVLANGLIVLTTWSGLTSSTDREITIRASNPSDALQILQRLETDQSERACFSQGRRDRSCSRDWEDLAARHITIYQDLLSRGAVPGSRDRHGTTEGNAECRV